MDWSGLFLGIILIIIGILLILRTKKRHDKIDTESVAVVVDVRDIGKIDGKKSYAIRYKIQCSEPFEIVETPCKKPRAIGSERTVFYEKADVSKERPIRNFYFKTIKQFDRRFIAPSVIVFFGLVIASSSFM